MELFWSDQVIKNRAHFPSHSGFEWLAILFWLSQLKRKKLIRAEGEIKHCRIKQEGRLFIIGSAQFESLVDLINYYEVNPLYGQVHLRIPVTDDILTQMEQGLPIGEPTCNSDPSAKELKQDLYLVSDALMGPMGVCIQQSFISTSFIEIMFKLISFVSDYGQVAAKLPKSRRRRTEFP